jgi:hypothetical protein
MSHYVQIFSYAALTQRRTWCPPGSSLEVQWTSRIIQTEMPSTINSSY